MPSAATVPDSDIMKKLRTLLGLLAALMVFRWVSCGPADEGPKGPRLTNRVWVDKVAEGPRDPVLHFVLVEKGQKRRGVIAQVTKFRMMADQLRYKQNGRKLTLVVPQDDRKMTFKTKVWRCGDAPRGFDLCLELRAGSRALRLYSKRKAAFAFEGTGLPALADEVDSGARVATPSNFDWFDARAR